MGHVPTTLSNAAFTNRKDISTYNQAVYEKHQKEFKAYSSFPWLRSFFVLSGLKKDFKV